MHRSTLAEGYLRGRADLRRANALYNLYASQAMINREVARSRNIENRSKARQAYFQLKRMARAERAERIAASRRYHARLKSRAKNASPTRLTVDQLDPVSGRIRWPGLLEGPRFSEYRNRLDLLFANRSVNNSGLGSENYREIRNVANQMKHRLRLHIREYDISHREQPSAERTNS